MNDNLDMMTQTEFVALISAYGGAVENWPDDQRRAMLAYCESDPTSGAVLSREKRLDEWLDSLLQTPPTDLEARLVASMEQALVASMEQTLQHSGNGSGNGSNDVIALSQRRNRARLWAATGALAACFVAGFVSAPTTIDILSGGANLTASLDILSDAFLPIEPL